MANEIYVLFRGPLPKTAALARALRNLDFPVSIPKPTGSLEQQKGFLPMRLFREKTGVELDTFDGRALVEEVADADIDDVDPSFDRVASFRWGGDENEMACAVCGAAALAGLVNGMVTDEYDSGIMPPDEAVAYARKAIAGIKPPDRKVGTTPAHIKRYLQPLLKQRGDLMMVGRFLLMRPIRHLVRGVEFLGRGVEFRFRLRTHFDLLAAPSIDRNEYGNYLEDIPLDVWQPHFQALLMHVLGEDALPDVGAITTLLDFAPKLFPRKHYTEYVKTLVLAGERDRAVDFVEKIEQASLVQGVDTKWEKTQWAFLARDIEDICAEAHAREAETIKAWKFEKIWEPSPFPVELPIPDRPGRSAEPPFVTKPWPERPPGMLPHLPDRPGEIRFAKDKYHRGQAIVLVEALTREEAEIRHQNMEDYVLAVRLPEGFLLSLQRGATGNDRHDPRHGSRSLGLRIEVKLIGVRYLVSATFCQRKQKGVLELWSAEVMELPYQRYKTAWRYFAGLNHDRIHVTDDPLGLDEKTSTRPPTDAEREFLTCEDPKFGEFDGIVTHVLALPRAAGFGEVS